MADPAGESRDARATAAIRGTVDAARDQIPAAPGALYLRPVLMGTDPSIGSAGSAEAGNETPNRVTVSSQEGVRSDKPLYFFLERYQASFVAELESFFTSIREDEPTPVGGTDGLMSVLIGLAASRSLVENRPISVEAP